MPVATVRCWTGLEAALLRGALRLSIRDFAERLGVGTRTINHWEARQASITQRPYMQEVLDTALAQASEEAKARFAAAIPAGTFETAQPCRHHQDSAGGDRPSADVVVVDRVVIVDRDAPGDDVVPSPLPGTGSQGVTVESSGMSDTWEVEWMLRRDFSGAVAVIALGMGADALDVERLLALMPQAAPTGTRHLGADDVSVIEQTTAVFRGQDWAHGSGMTRDATVAQLRSVLPLLDSHVVPELRPRLQVATADLALQAAWMSLDQRRHHAAQRLWMIGLDIARTTDHPWATDLTVHLLIDMANQAEHLDRPEEVLHLVRVAHTVAARGRHPISPAETTCLNAVLAWAHAARGDSAGCDRALGEAADWSGSITPGLGGPWTANITEAFLAARQGHAHYALAVAGQDARAAARAVPLLGRAVEHYGPVYARSTALYLPELAGAHALAGDADTAVTVGHRAVDAVTAVSSLMAHHRLGALHTVLEPLSHQPGVAELRDRLTTAA